MTNIDAQYIERLNNAHQTSERVQLATESDCPQWLLSVFCREDTEQEVAEAAMLNLQCLEEDIEFAYKRFPNIDKTFIEKIRNKKTWANSILKEIEDEERIAKKSLSGDRDQILLDHILKKDKIVRSPTHSSLHIGKDVDSDGIVFKNPYRPWDDTEKYRVAMIMAPSWGVTFPPYNIAKLTGLLRQQGYSVKVYDANVESYHYFLDNHGQDYWRSERYFLWVLKHNYDKYLAPDLSKLLDKIVDDIIVSNVKVVGFSIFNTNFYATMYMVDLLRILVPDICILAGGPETITGSFRFETHGEAWDKFNYVFIGESEENLLNLLDNLPEEYPMNEKIGSLKSRLNLDIFPYADYTDYDFNNYVTHGASIETSRGCVAQCSFCAETYFWKFRSLTPERVVEEIEEQVKLHNIERFWFVDSLANGNVKSFEKLIDLILEKSIKISWNSYVRCDGRMTKEFIKKIKDSGCTALSYGVESGSQKVLYDFRKKVDVWEIEQNLRDGYEIGLFNHANWLVGFPTEEAIDNFHSLQLVYNMRNWVGAISPGYTANPSSHSHLETDWAIYGITWNNKPWDRSFLKTWFTNNYKNTKIHRFLRLKLLHIWMDLLKDYKEMTMINSQRPQGLEESYEFNFKENTIVDYVPQDYCVNFDQFKDSFEDSIANEYVAFCFLLYKYFGECSFDFVCNPKIDIELFGDNVADQYESTFSFTVLENGSFNFNLTHKLIHTVEHEIRERDMSFASTKNCNGNIKEWQTDTPQERITIHEIYRPKK